MRRHLSRPTESHCAEKDAKMNAFGVWTSLLEAIIAYVLMRRLCSDRYGKFQWRMRPFAVAWFYAVIACSVFNLITALYWGERSFEFTRRVFRFANI